MRVISLTKHDNDKELIDGLTAFVERDFSEYIVLAVTFDSPDSRFSGPALQAFATARVGTLKNGTYLERKDGKRIFPADYYPPSSDALGAKFVFTRLVDGKEFLSSDSGTVRFYSELNPQIKLNVTFKVSEMIYNGKLEY